jgi:hypothetical protein
MSTIHFSRHRCARHSKLNLDYLEVLTISGVVVPKVSCIVICFKDPPRYEWVGCNCCKQRFVRALIRKNPED